MDGFPARRVPRWILVALFVSLSMMGVPAVLSSARPNRERNDVATVLVIGEDLARIPG
ncbi:MAG TPA: hypothetical protein VMP42_05685 [Actinomycetota bacterium]|nr:hypothetical protein [Actinomycetota bacterium]